VSANSVFDAKGNYIGALAMITDISERAAAERTLRESEARYRRLIETAHEGVWQTDTERRTTFVNERLTEMLGYGAAELAGRTPGEFLIEEDRGTLPLIERHHGVSLTEQYPMRFRRKDGTTLWATASICSTFDDNGVYTGKIGLVADISERVLAEAEVQRSLTRLEALREIDQAILGAQSVHEIAAVCVRQMFRLIPLWGASVMEFDYEAAEARVLYMHRPTDPDSWVGRCLTLDAFGRADIATLATGRECFVADLDAGPVRGALFDELYKKGLRAYARIPLFVEGRLVGTLNLASDRKDGIAPDQIAMARPFADALAIALRQAALRGQVERQAADLERRVVERTAQLQAVNRELESFTASVSHDLRAPARHIDGFASMLLQEAKGLDEGVKGTLERIVRAARRMNRLIDDLLALARTGTKELSKTDVDMNALVAEVQEELAPQVGLRRIDWRIAAMPAAHGDASLLRVVMQNLLGNAIKYSSKRDDAVITVGARETASGRREFFVRDNGAGFDMAYAGKLFGVFSRLHSERDFEGTGVGLATVQRIVNRHGGRIQAMGSVGEGAEFSFTLA
jgi:PAS domain S-box-containing protein